MTLDFYVYGKRWFASGGNIGDIEGFIRYTSEVPLPLPVEGHRIVFMKAEIESSAAESRSRDITEEPYIVMGVTLNYEKLDSGVHTSAYVLLATEKDVSAIEEHKRRRTPV